MTAIDAASELLEARRAELQAELVQIEAALQALSETPSRSSRASQGRRAPRGHRRQQVLDYLKDNSNAKSGQIASALGIRPSQASALIRTLRNEKLVRKTRGGGYSMALPRS